MTRRDKLTLDAKPILYYIKRKNEKELSRKNRVIKITKKYKEHFIQTPKQVFIVLSLSLTISLSEVDKILIA